MPPDERAPTAEGLAALAEGDIELRGRMPWSSNATFLVVISHQGAALPAVYKPLRGERPLWDFPGGLFTREVAAYRLSEALGWRLVPETVARADGPLGPGSLQRFIPADFSEHYFTLLEDPERHEALQAIATFDIVANNADRKSGHCLLGPGGPESDGPESDDPESDDPESDDPSSKVWAIDNGLCFHAEANLRTVIWDFAGQPIPDHLLADLERLADGSLDLSSLDDLLDPTETAAVRERAAAVLQAGVFPSPDHSHRAYPWPLV